MVLAVSSSVAHNLEASNHLANAKEPKDLCCDNSCANQSVAVQVPYSVEEVLGIARGGLCGAAGSRSEAGRITNSFCDGLEIALEGLESPVKVNRMS